MPVQTIGMPKPVRQPSNQHPADRANQLPSWITQDPHYAKLSHAERHGIQVIADRCRRMPDGNLEGCLGGRDLERAMGVSRSTKIRYLAKFRKHGWVVELARGITLNRTNYASVYGIPARRATPCQADTGGGVNVRRAPHSETRIGFTQSAHSSKTQHPTQAVGVGVSRDKPRVGHWPNITEHDLRAPDRLLDLHAWYAERGFITQGEYGQRLFFEAAENALTHSTKNKVGMFVRRIRDWQQQELFPISNKVADRAQERLKQALGHATGPRERADDWREEVYRAG